MGMSADANDRDFPLFLVIDDDVTIHGALRKMIRAAGWDYVGAVDGPQGIEMAHEMKPDVILLDVGMPQLDGRDVIARLRQEPALANIPVVVISGRAADPYCRESALNAGAYDVFEKPFDVDHLTRRLAWLVEKIRRHELASVA